MRLNLSMTVVTGLAAGLAVISGSGILPVPASAKGSRDHVEFARDWKKWEAFPFSEKKVTKILEHAGGRVGYAATRGHLRVISAPHRTPGGDPYIHLTVGIQDPAPKQTCHVHLTSKGKVHDTTCQ